MTRRALTLIELLLAMTITAMVAAAIAAMLGAVSTGVGTRRDNRSVMVLANAAESRLSAYIAPSQCVLSNDGQNLVLWLADTRESETVHATEVRWLVYNAAEGTIEVCFVDFPAAWSQAACDLEDREFASNANWTSVLNGYESSGWITRQTLVDRLGDVTLTADSNIALSARHLMYDLLFDTESMDMPVTVAGTIRQHAPPVK